MKVHKELLDKIKKQFGQREQNTESASSQRVLPPDSKMKFLPVYYKQIANSF